MQPPLYKYLSKRNLEAFLSRGSLKIGTLLDYRKTETYGHAIGDKNEGLYMTELFLEGGGEIDLASNSPEAEYFRKYVLLPNQQDAKVKMILEEGARLVAHSNSPDLYIYCMSSEYSSTVMKEFDCDACLQILRPTMFFDAISRRIRYQASFNGLGSVKYLNKTTHYTHPHTLHPAVMKDPYYEYQKEWRAIWVPEKAPKQPLIVNVPQAIRHCRAYPP